MITPIIKIKYDLKKEADKFLAFLHHPQFPQHRNLIFQAFPNLESEIKKTDDEKNAVANFIIKFREDNKNKINQIIQESKNLIKEDGQSALKALSELMDYQWKKTTIYTAIPTILPFSPFEKDIFYFSILGQIHNKKNKDVLSIAIHEISHSIFYEILGELERESLITPLQNDVKNYFKETLAVVLLNQKPLCDILNLHNYIGNPEIRDIQIQKSNEVIISFTNFLKGYYENIKIKEKETFKTFLQKILNIIMPISSEFSEKCSIWNSHGMTMFKKEKILRLYRQPIKIKEG